MPRIADTPPAWVEPYIGRKFKEHGIGPEAFDCWGLFRHALLHETGIELPTYLADREHLKNFDEKATAQEIGRVIAANMGGWKLIDAPVYPAKPMKFDLHKPHDALLIRMVGNPFHVGMVVAPGLMLHIEIGSNSTWDRYHSFKWRNRVLGVYRYAGR